MQKENPLETISEIRGMMERSSRFMSLSGLSGVFAGVFAVAFYVLTVYKFNLDLLASDYLSAAFNSDGSPDLIFYNYYIKSASIILILSLGTAFLLSRRNARRDNLTFNDVTAKRLAINLFVPLLTGGIFCLLLLHHGVINLIAPSMLIFYGLSLLNASKYTVNDIRFWAY